MHKTGWRTPSSFILFGASLVFLLNSCGDSTGPDLPDYCAIAYSTVLFTEVPGDSFFLEIGTDYLPVREEE